MVDRQRWAVERVVASRPESVLEIGCGAGVAVRLLVEALPEARVLGIDRSATAVERAAARLGDLLVRGRVALRQVAIADLDLLEASVDVVLGVNVNVFWTSSAERELTVLRRVLRPGGVLHLVYEPPGRDPWVRSGVEAALQRAGWSWTVVQKRRRLALSAQTWVRRTRPLVAFRATPEP